jgi:hypothetical protein
MMSQDRVDIAAFASTLPVEYNTKELRKAGVLIDLPTPVWDKRTQELFLRVGNQFYWSDVKRKTFHEIMIDHLSTVLGKDWKLTQASLPLAERHFIFECYNETDSYLNGGAVEVRKENEELNSVAPNGYVQSLISLAFDIYLLKNAGVLDEKLLRRLRLKDQYQGARYEMTVASAFVKAGWSIEWCKDKQGVPIPEFIATSSDGTQKIAVEAKSKHRDGVLHKNGLFDPKNAEKGNMLYLFKEALGKETFGLPYAIFLDLNSPQTIAKKDKEHWLRDLMALFDSVDPNHNEETVDKQNLVVSTNFSPHYDGKEIAVGGQYVVAYSLKPEHHIPQIYLDDIIAAASNVQSVPMLFPSHIN